MILLAPTTTAVRVRPAPTNVGMVVRAREAGHLG